MRDEGAGVGRARPCDIYGTEEKKKQKKKAKDVPAVGTRMKMAARREQRRRLASYDHTQVGCRYSMPVFNPVLQLLMGGVGGAPTSR